MVEVSAVAVFLIGVVVGMLFGVMGIIILAFKYKGKDEKDGNKKEK